MELLDALLHDRTVLLAESYLHAFAELSAVHAADGYAAYVAREVERCDEHLGRSFDGGRSGYILDDGVEHRRDVVGGLLPVVAHPSLLGGAVYGGEVELILTGVEIAHQVKHHFLHLLGAAVGLVDLVDHDHRLQSELYGFLKHEAGLRHRALESVDEKQTAVGHVEHTLHLAAEVGVSRGVDDVDLGVLVGNGDVLGEYRYASFTFEVVVVEDEFAGRLIVAEKVSGE